MLLTRPSDRIPETEAIAREHGLLPVSAPMLVLREIPSPGLPSAVDRLVRGEIDVVVFSSATAVRLALQRAAGIANRRPVVAALARASTVAIGPVTHDALEAAGVPGELVPEEHSSEGILGALAGDGLRGRRVLLLRSDQGTPELPRGLRAAGAEVADVALYTLDPPPLDAALGDVYGRIARGDLAAFTFGSERTVENFLALSDGSGSGPAVRTALEVGVVGAIGEPTRRALARAGVRVDVVPAEARFPALLAEVARQVFRQRGHGDA
ncbi:MAG: uroporphyrinogen-III synthase [Methanobacteriota archaeon]